MSFQVFCFGVIINYKSLILINYILVCIPGLLCRDLPYSGLPKLLHNKSNTKKWIWPRIFLFVLFWWAFYWIVLQISNKGPEYCCRFVTLLHGMTISYFTLKDIIINKQEFDYCFRTPLTPYQIYFLSITISYFLFDFVWIHLFGAESLTVHLHHICSIILLFKVITSDTGGPEISYGLLGLEITNPYLQTRWFLRTHGYQHSLIHRIVELWFIFLFVIIRVVGGTLLLYHVEIHPDMDIFLKIAFIGIYIVSWLLIIQILQFLKKRYFNYSNPLLTPSVLSIFPYRRRLRNSVSRPTPQTNQTREGEEEEEDDDGEDGSNV